MLEEVRKVVKQDISVNILLKTMAALGIGINQTQRLYSWILLAVTVLSLGILTAAGIILSINGGSLTTSLTILGWVLISVMDLISSCYFRIRRKQIRIIVSNVFKLQPYCVKQKELLFKVTIFFAYNVINTVWQTVVCFNITDDVNGILKIPPVVSKIMVLIMVVGTLLILNLSENLMILLYITLCRDITEMYKALCWGQYGSNRASKDTVMSIMARYERIYGIVNSMDDFFSFLMFLCALKTGIALIIDWSSVMDFNAINKIGISFAIFVAIGVICRFFIFSDLCISASHVADMAQRSIKEIFDWSHCYEDHHMQKMIFHYYVEYTSQPPILTAWKAITVNRGLLLTVCSVVVMYLFVMKQMSC